MNRDRIEGNWKQFTGKAKEKWGHPTDDDLTAIGGNRTRHAGKLQEHYGCAKDRVRKEPDDFATALKE